MSETLLEVLQARKRYEDGQIQALDGVDLTIAAGEFITISGPSGSGKSTMLTCWAGWIRRPPARCCIAARTSARRSTWTLPRDPRRVYLPGVLLLPSLNAMENVQVPWLGGSVASQQTRRDGA